MNVFFPNKNDVKEDLIEETLKEKDLVDALYVGGDYMRYLEIAEPELYDEIMKGYKVVANEGKDGIKLEVVNDISWSSKLDTVLKSAQEKVEKRKIWTTIGGEGLKWNLDRAIFIAGVQVEGSSGQYRLNNALSSTNVGISKDTNGIKWKLEEIDDVSYPSLEAVTKDALILYALKNSINMNLPMVGGDSVNPYTLDEKTVKRHSTFGWAPDIEFGQADSDKSAQALVDYANSLHKRVNVIDSSSTEASTEETTDVIAQLAEDMPDAEAVTEALAEEIPDAEAVTEAIISQTVTPAVPDVKEVAPKATQRIRNEAEFLASLAGEGWEKYATKTGDENAGSIEIKGLDKGTPEYKYSRIHHFFGKNGAAMKLEGLNGYDLTVNGNTAEWRITSEYPSGTLVEAGTKNRLLVETGTKIEWKKKEPVPVEAPAQSPVVIISPEAILKIKAGEIAETLDEFNKLMGKERALAQREADAKKAYDKVKADKKGAFETDRHHKKELATAKGVYDQEMEDISNGRTVLAQEYRKLQPALNAVNPNDFDEQDAYTDTLKSAKELVAYRDGGSDGVAPIGTRIAQLERPATTTA